MHIDVVKKPESIISCEGVGTKLDINISAAGMVLASALEEDELNNLINNTIFTKNIIYTLSKLKRIKKELKKVYTKGYAFNDQQYAIGVRCLAAPVFNFEDKVIVTINITGHIYKMTDDNIDFLNEKLLKAALEAFRIMGFEKLSSCLKKLITIKF